MNTPIEQLEMRFPFMVDRYEIIPDSGGAGKYRGGCGVRRTWRILDHTALATVCAEPHQVAALRTLRRSRRLADEGLPAESRWPRVDAQ